MADVVVIGGGLNGLVAAAWLARHKRSVVLLEQQEAVGGAAVTAEIAPGVLAPGVSHAIGPVAAQVIRALRLDRAKLDVITPNPALTAIGEGVRPIVFHPDPVLTAGSIHQASAADAGRWQPFLRASQTIAGVVASLNRHAPPDIDARGSREWWRLVGTGRRIRKLSSRDLANLARWMPMPVADVTAEWFESDLLRAAICARALFGNFAGPRSAGTGGMLVQRIAEDALPVGSGVTVRGGPGALTHAVAARLTERGGQIRTGARVVRILSTDDRASGVELDTGEQIPASAVVAAIDPKTTLLRLVDPADLTPTAIDRARHLRARGVMAKIALALSEEPVFPVFDGDKVPLRGRILIAGGVDYLEKAFDAAKYGQCSPHPWLEVSIPTVVDSSLAPDGQHVMSIYVHYAPRDLRGTTWAAERESLYRSVLRTLEPHAPGLERSIIAREILTPEDLESRLGASGGHIFHGEPTLDQFWISRPWLGWSQYRAPLDGLFFASAGTHPGGGLTGMSGLLAAQAVHKAQSRRR
jgi:phytoene dehydrogenase-like protein